MTISSYDELTKYITTVISEKLGITAWVSPKTVLSLKEPLKNFGADSLDLWELIVQFEKEFGVSISEEDIDYDISAQIIIDKIAEQKHIMPNVQNTQTTATNKPAKSAIIQTGTKPVQTPTNKKTVTNDSKKKHITNNFLNDIKSVLKPRAK